MNLDGKEVTIIGLVVAWFFSAIGYAVDSGKRENRLQKCEKICDALSSAVTLPQCVERMESIKATNNLQFHHSAEQAIEIKELIKSSNKQHREDFDKLMAMLDRR